MNVIHIPEYGKHILFCGSTGSGKSRLACEMLKHYDSKFIIDTQDSLDFNDTKIVESPKHLQWLLKHYKSLQYIPKLEYRNKGVWNYIYKTINETSTKRKPLKRVVYADEIFHLGYGNSFPNWISKSITTARQKQISLWFATQRPKCIPPEILTEASKIYVFSLSRYEDRKTIAAYGRNEPKELLNAMDSLDVDEHNFIEIDVRKGTFQKFGKLSLK